MGSGFKWMGLKCPSCGCNGTTVDCDVQESSCMSQSGCGIDRTSISFSGLSGVTATQDATTNSGGSNSYFICTTGITKSVTIFFGTQYKTLDKHELSFIETSSNTLKTYKVPNLVTPNYSCSGSDTLYLDGIQTNDSITISWTGSDYDPCCGCNINGYQGDWENGEPNWANVTGEMHNYNGGKFASLDTSSGVARVCSWNWDYILDADGSYEGTRGIGYGPDTDFWQPTADIGGGTDCYTASDYHPITNPFGRTYYICYNGENNQPLPCPCEGQGVAVAQCFEYSNRVDNCDKFCRREEGQFAISNFIFDEGFSTEETPTGPIAELDSFPYTTVDKLYGFPTTSQSGANYRYLWYGSRGAAFGYRWGWFTTDVLLNVGDPANSTFIAYPAESVCSEDVNAGQPTRFTLTGIECGDRT